MQIQRTGYQGNFGKAVPVITKDYKLIDALRSFYHEFPSVHPGGRFDLMEGDNSFYRVLLTDGDEAAAIIKKRKEYETAGKDRPSLRRFMNDLYESIFVKSEPIEVSFDTVLQIPMFQNFRGIVSDYFVREKW